jgi:hypothetical protein
VRALLLLAAGPCMALGFGIAAVLAPAPYASTSKVEAGDDVLVVGLDRAPRERSSSAASAGATGATGIAAPSEQREAAAPRAVPTIPARVDLVDAETGRTIRGAVWSWERNGSPTASGETVDIPYDADLLRVRRFVAPGPGTPQARSLWDVVWVGLSRYASSVVATWPFAPEADVFIALTAQGAPPPPHWRIGFSAWVAGRHYVASAVPRVGGVRLEGLPFLRAARWSVHVTARCGDRACGGSAQGVMAADGAEPVIADVDLPPIDESFEEPDFNDYIGCGGCCCGGTFVAEPSDPASVVATALRRDGRPAARCVVQLMPLEPHRRFFSGRTDAQGRIRWTSVSAGAFALELREPGLVPTSVVVTIEAGVENVVALREQPGATVDVVVQDERGDGVPFAELRVKQPSEQEWIDLVDGVQRLDPFVDVRGRRVLENVEPGEVSIEAIYADRKGRGVVRVEPGGSARLAITIAHE